jgi:hypothetical protein
MLQQTKKKSINSGVPTKTQVQNSMVCYVPIKKLQQSQNKGYTHGYKKTKHRKKQTKKP